MHHLSNILDRQPWAGVLASLGGFTASALSALNLISAVIGLIGAILGVIAGYYTLRIQRAKWLAHHPEGARKRRGTFRHLLFLFLVITWQGCALIPTERKKTNTQQTADNVAAQVSHTFERVTTGRPAPQPAPVVNVAPAAPAPVTVSGSSNVVTITAPSAPASSIQNPAPSIQPTEPFVESVKVTSATDLETKSKSDDRTTSAVSIPLGVKIGLIGVGLLLLVLGFKALSNYLRGTAAGAMLNVADAALKRRIDAWETRARLSTDPAEIANAAAELRELEAERGKLRSQRP